MVIGLNGIYVRLRNNTWLKVKGKIGGIVTSRVRKTTYTLVVESLDEPPHIDDPPDKRFYITSSKVTRYIYRLIDHGYDKNNIVLIKYLDPEKYLVETYGSGSREIYSVAEELGIVRKTREEV